MPMYIGNREVKAWGKFGGDPITSETKIALGGGGIVYAIPLFNAREDEEVIAWLDPERGPISCADKKMFGNAGIPWNIPLSNGIPTTHL